jgi:hypothetical protein
MRDHIRSHDHRALNGPSFPCLEFRKDGHGSRHRLELLTGLAPGGGWGGSCTSEYSNPAFHKVEMMLQMVMTTGKVVALPVLLLGSLFSRFAASYEFLLNALICLGALIIVQRAIWVKKYFWAAGFLAIVVVFSPLLLVVRIFLLMGFTCLAACATLVAAWKTRPLPVA